MVVSHVRDIPVYAEIKFKTDTNLSLSLTHSRPSPELFRSLLLFTRMNNGMPFCTAAIGREEKEKILFFGEFIEKS